MPLAISGRTPTFLKARAKGRTLAATVSRAVTATPRRAPVISRGRPPVALPRKGVVVPFQRIPVPSVRPRPTQEIEDVGDFDKPFVAPKAMLQLGVTQPPNPLVAPTPWLEPPVQTTGEPSVIEKVLTAGEKIVTEIEKLPETIENVKAGARALPGEIQQARADLEKAAQLRDIMIIVAVVVGVLFLLK